MSRLHVNLLFSGMLLLTGIYTQRIVDIRVIDITRIKYYIKFRHIFDRNCRRACWQLVIYSCNYTAFAFL